MRRSQAMLVKRLMILLPVLNEAEGLDIVLRTIPSESLIELGWEPNIVIVDGKSTDDSQQIAIDTAHSPCPAGRGKGETRSLVLITQSESF